MEPRGAGEEGNEVVDRRHMWQRVGQQLLRTDQAHHKRVCASCRHRTDDAAAAQPAACHSHVQLAQIPAAPQVEQIPFWVGLRRLVHCLQHRLLRRHTLADKDRVRLQHHRVRDATRHQHLPHSAVREGAGDRERVLPRAAAYK